MIETKRMRFRKANLGDVKTLISWWNDGRLMESVGFPEGLHTNEEKVKKQINREDHVLLIAFDKEDETPIGEFSYGQIDEDAGTLRIGMKIANLKYQGKGYGRETLKYLLPYLFEFYALDAIFVDTFFTNERARNLYESFGAEVESIEKDYWTNPHGRHYDVIFYRITKENLEEALHHMGVQ